VKVPLPPRWLRRIVIDPLFWVVGLWLLVGGIPAIVLLVALVSFALPGKLRPLRLTGFALVYLTMEVVVLAATFLTWVGSGFGWALDRPRFVAAHYRILRAALGALFWFGRRYFELTVEADGPWLPGDDDDPSTTEYPLLVMSRHAGPGDSFLLVHELLSWAGRRPRIVLKHTLQWDPAIDVLLNRLPMSFVDPTSDRQQGSLAEITRLASTMDARDALLIFPEGGNVTPKRRRRAIDRLRAAGRHEAATRAERIVHLMPPRPGGVHAALTANTDLQVVVVAHTGLDQLDSVADIWRELPVSKMLHMRWHAVPSQDVPHDIAGLSDWLFTEWEQMDGWVAAHRAANGRVPGDRQLDVEPTAAAVPPPSPDAGPDAA
jgi:1-acyl-sn-glycerol-3-phosphate acyltransferase